MPQAARAQVVRGQVVSAEEGRPLPRAFVILQDAGGGELVRARTDGLGRYVLVAPGAGTYTLRTAVIGIQSWVSRPVNVGATDTLDVRITLALRPVQLDSIVVTGDQQCRADPTGGSQTLAVWAEARKALAAVAWTEQSDSLWYHVLQYHRVLNPGTLRPIEGSVNRLTGTSPAGPFLSLNAEELSDGGYVQEVDGGWKPYGPDADVLLSETFANDHCFYLRTHPTDTTRIGVAFEPARGRRLPDIKGVFWLDRITAGLRSLEFQYDRLPWPVSSRHIGGEIDFRQMSNGLWVVEEWRLRLPEMRRRGASAVGDVAVTRYRETGGLVVQLRSRAGEVLTAADVELLMADEADPPGPTPVRGVLRGTVQDSVRGAPVDGAAVFLLDERDRIHDVAFTTPQGWFELHAPEEGRFRLDIHRRGYLAGGSELIYLGDGKVVDTAGRLVRLPSEDPDASGFGRRRREAITLFGFDRLEIQALGAESVLDVLVTIPGVRGHPRARAVVHLNERRCAPDVLIDGIPAVSPVFLITQLAGWVAAVEVFTAPKDTPLEFLQGMRSTAGQCGTVAIWTTSMIADPAER